MEKDIEKIKEAIMMLADYLEDPVHSDYKIRSHIEKILGKPPSSGNIK